MASPSEQGTKRRRVVPNKLDDPFTQPYVVQIVCCQLRKELNDDTKSRSN